MQQRVLCLWLPKGLDVSGNGARGLDGGGTDAGGTDCQSVLRGEDAGGADALLAWCERFTPVAGWLSEDGIPRAGAALVLEITHTSAWFGGEEALVARVVKDCRRMRLPARIAVAGTIGAAWGLAAYEERPILHLPVAALRLPADVLERLAELGIERIEQVAALPRESLAARFGPELSLRLDQMFGAAEEVLPAAHRAPQFAARRLLEYPTRRQDVLEDVLAGLVKEIAEQLAARRVGALRMACRLELEGAAAVEFSLGLYVASAAAVHLRQLIALRLEKLRLAADVEAAMVIVTATGPLANEQRTLFEEEAERTCARELAGLVDRLATRLGAGAVRRARLVADAQAEWAVRYENLVGGSVGRPATTKGRSAATVGTRSLRSRLTGTQERSLGTRLARPLFLFRRAVVLEVISVFPDGPPLAFRYAGEDHQAARFWGPERIETGWWRGAPVWRDYYRVETTRGAWFWIFRRRGDGRWRLHGEF